MVRAKLMVGRSVRYFRRARERTGVGRWNVAKLQGACVDDRGIVIARERFVECLRERLKENGIWAVGQKGNGMS